MIVWSMEGTTALAPFTQTLTIKNDIYWAIWSCCMRKTHECSCKATVHFWNPRIAWGQRQKGKHHMRCTWAAGFTETCSDVVQKKFHFQECRSNLTSLFAGSEGPQMTSMKLVQRQHRQVYTFLHIFNHTSFHKSLMSLYNIRLGKKTLLENITVYLLPMFLIVYMPFLSIVWAKLQKYSIVWIFCDFQLQNFSLQFSANGTETVQN